ncbi:O-antigen ligase family protein [Sphingomicrobium aestuariivivum]|uniref:O-antigen ligase family protein n=1 Tax=Sphingomicrobium aestuariivivum TaxID=1582356 RepID=UPI001FD6B09F|nr:O-antigen ligase family protein [Sphingomicrobium aestuariivivum]MCJ8192038.1 O-antigen ligase family protein [Sphingomicrobium aestuariivivum]
MSINKPINHAGRTMSAQWVDWQSSSYLFLLVSIIGLGGSSHNDAGSFPVLLALAAIACAVFILSVDREALRAVRVPLSALACIGSIAIVQLIPLPPEWWQSLPERAPIAALDRLMALEVWRPVTLSPMATLNSLFSTVIPLAALLGFATIGRPTLALFSLVALGVGASILGIVQQRLPSDSWLFFYEVSNRGSAVGFFANRNHHAVFLACCLLISLFLTFRVSRSDQKRSRPFLLSGAAILSFAILASGSRAGLVSLFLACLIWALHFVYANKPNAGATSAHLRRLTMAALVTGIGTAIFALFVLTGRSPAWMRLLDTDPSRELRHEITPILVDIAADFQPFGTGLGAFEYAYRMREPTALLMPSYVNEAHNDWLQFIIEGGAVALALLLFGSALALQRLVKLTRGGHSNATENAEAWLGFGLMLILATASLVDYPLRTPAMMTVAILALALFAQPLVKRHRL